MRKKTLIRTGLILFFAAAITGLSWVPVKKETAFTPVTEKTVKTTEEPKISKTELFNSYIDNIYTAADLSAAGLDFEVFKKALTGYLNLKNEGRLSGKEIISIADFNQSSSKKRLWIIDLAKKELLFNTYVAHGQGSGGDMAVSFSNKANSHQSSLGFYITSEIYYGKHGQSLKLDGMDEKYNTNARNRAIVVHGASYVSRDFINQHGRLGRSHGCPAVPVELTPAIIDTIKGKTCLFINAPEKTAYASAYLNQDTAAEAFAPEFAKQ